MILTNRWGRLTESVPSRTPDVQLSAGGLLLLPAHTSRVEGVPAAIDGGAALGYLWLGTAGGIVAYTLWFRGIQQLPVIAPGLLALLSPIVATILGVLVAGERFTGVQAIGLVLTIGALVLGQIVARRPTADIGRSRETSSAAALARFRAERGSALAEQLLGSRRGRPHSALGLQHHRGRSPNRSASRSRWIPAFSAARLAGFPERDPFDRLALLAPLRRRAGGAPFRGPHHTGNVRRAAAGHGLHHLRGPARSAAPADSRP